MRWLVFAFVITLVSCTDHGNYSMVAGGYEDYDDGDILTFVYDDDDFLDPAESFPVDANPKLAAMSSEDSQYQKVYRYGFDESVLNDGAKKSLTELADSLLVSPAQRVKVEGHTCEMGSREYNIALGWRRANSVKNFLISQGVLASQIEVISYGQEKPVDLGHSEKSRHKNRRAQIKFIHEKT